MRDCDGYTFDLYSFRFDTSRVLTYMSLLDEVNRLCSEPNGLYRVPRSLPEGLHQGRFIYGSGLIRTFLSGADLNKRLQMRVAELQADLDYFMDGRRIDLRPLGSIEEYAYMALLEPPTNEVWEIRSVDPKPSIRVFGSFIHRNHFVVLTWAWRKELGGRYAKEWRAAIQEFKEEWEIYFGSKRPISGRYPDAYLSNARVIS